MNVNTPVVGQWYIGRTENYRFSVTGVDDVSGYIELADQDGFIAGISTNVWPHIDAERIILADVRPRDKTLPR